MSGDRVVPLRAASPETTGRRPGYLDLHWLASQDPHTKRWEVLGELPDRAGVMHARITAPFLPRAADPEAVARVLAQLLNDLDPGAAALMEDALLNEGRTND